MGDFRVRKINNAADRHRMYQYALDDISVFEKMLEEDAFTKSKVHIGAEQELCVVDRHYNPSANALQLLDEIADKHYTNELARFNLEINLDPFPLSDNCFSSMEKSLLKLLAKGKTVARNHDTHFLLCGILPTLKYRHLNFDYMTPIQRYQTISKTLLDLRGDDFEIYLQGTDEMIMSLDSILFEACNTSFQLHLQIPPEEFVDKHNWSQMIAGAVLSACVNSPMLFGNELWAETRIAIFKQSLDTRSSKRFLRNKRSRVYFGSDWIKTTAAELWKNDLMRFPLVVTSDTFEKASEVYGTRPPDLRAIRLHNGTTYTWNRMCYGFSGNEPHLRIECRYLPAGPTPIDEIANFVFWVGLMQATPPQGSMFWKTTDFKSAKSNFIKAARTGLSSVFEWFGQNIPAKVLVLEHLLPMAQSGLEKININPADIEKYLSIIKNRVAKEQTGAAWTVSNFRRLSDGLGQTRAEKLIAKAMVEYQDANTPVGEWSPIQKDAGFVQALTPIVEQVMSKDVFSVGEEGSIELAKDMMRWNHIHHLPVENTKGNLIGLLTDGLIQRMEASSASVPENRLVKDIMLTNLVTVNSTDTVDTARALMEKNGLKGLPVVNGAKLIGMVTMVDLGAVMKN